MYDFTIQADGSYLCEYWCGNGDYYSTTRPDYAAAQRWLAQMIAQYGRE